MTSRVKQRFFNKTKNGFKYVFFFFFEKAISYKYIYIKNMAKILKIAVCFFSSFSLQYIELKSYNYYFK